MTMDAMQTSLALRRIQAVKLNAYSVHGELTEPDQKSSIKNSNSPLIHLVGTLCAAEKKGIGYRQIKASAAPKQPIRRAAPRLDKLTQSPIRSHAAF